jgi:type I restriction enzyme S subunit
MACRRNILLGDVCSFQKGASIPRGRTGVGLDVPYLHYGDIYKKYSVAVDVEDAFDSIIKISADEKVKPEQRLRDQDIVYNLTSETIDDLGKSVVIRNRNDIPFVAGMETTVMRVEKPELVYPPYLNYVLQTRQFYRILQQYVTGMKVFRVHPRDIARIELSVPPIDVQRRIADLGDSITRRIVNNTKINHHLEQMVQALYKSWFVDFEPFASGGLIDSELGRIPAGWSAQTVESIAEKVAMGPFGSNIKVETFVESGVPIISGNHLRGLYLDEWDYNFITEEHARRLSNACAQAGDVVFTHAGSIGQVALIPDDCDYPRYVVSQRQFYLRCDRQKALPEYINYYFPSREGQGKLLANASQTGVPTIARPASHLRSMVVPLPPVEVQREWLSTVGAMLRTLTSNTKEGKRLMAARDALLPRLMSGELPIAAADAE